MFSPRNSLVPVCKRIIEGRNSVLWYASRFFCIVSVSLPYHFRIMPNSLYSSVFSSIFSLHDTMIRKNSTISACHIFTVSYLSDHTDRLPRQKTRNNIKKQPRDCMAAYCSTFSTVIYMVDQMNRLPALLLRAPFSNVNRWCLPSSHQFSEKYGLASYKVRAG